QDVPVDDPAAVQVFFDKGGASLDARDPGRDRVVTSEGILRDVYRLYFRCPRRATGIKTRVHVAEGHKETVGKLGIRRDNEVNVAAMRVEVTKSEGPVQIHPTEAFAQDQGDTCQEMVQHEVDIGIGRR